MTEKIQNPRLRNFHLSRTMEPGWQAANHTPLFTSKICFNELARSWSNNLTHMRYLWFLFKLWLRLDIPKFMALCKNGHLHSCRPSKDEVQHSLLVSNRCCSILQMCLWQSHISSFFHFHWTWHSSIWVKIAHTFSWCSCCRTALISSFWRGSTFICRSGWSSRGGWIGKGSNMLGGSMVIKDISAMPFSDLPFLLGESKHVFNTWA